MIAARIKIVIAMMIIGTIGIFAKNIFIPPSIYALCRSILASGEIGFYLMLTRQKIDFKSAKKEIILFILSGAFLGFNWSLLYEAYKYIPYSVATLCDYFAPIVVIVLCPFLYKEKLTKKQILCFSMATLGLLLLIGIGGNTGEKMSPYGLFVGITAMLCYVPVLIINKMIKNVNGIQRTFFQFAGAALVLAIFALFKGDYDFSQMTYSGWINLLIVGIVHTGIAYCMYFSSLPHLPGQEGAILSYVDPLTAILVAVVFMNESMSVQQVIGSILLLAFTFSNEITLKNKG